MNRRNVLLAGTTAMLPTTLIAIERYAGPVHLSHGEADAVWSVACTRQLG